MVNSSFIEKTYVVGTHWNCFIEPPHRGNSNVSLHHMLLKIRKTILEFTFIPSIMLIVFASFKHLKLPISIEMPVTILLYVCMTATNSFMNYFFANLVVAWWYLLKTVNKSIYIIWTRPYSTHSYQMRIKVSFLGLDLYVLRSITVGVNSECFG